MNRQSLEHLEALSNIVKVLYTNSDSLSRETAVELILLGVRQTNTLLGEFEKKMSSLS